MGDQDSVILGFDSTPRTRLVFGPGTLGRLGELAIGCGMRRPLVVTDRGIVAAGHVERARRSLAEAGMPDAPIYDAVRENPTTRDVADCLAAARAGRVDGFIGLGGGSSLDTAKACNLLLTNGGRIEDYRGYGRAVRPLLPLIAVPTTAGTGSECQSYALIADEATHQKMACGDPGISARVALLDPTLTLSQPPPVTACTGIDALAHSIESAVSRARTELSLIYSREAFRLLIHHLKRVLDHPGDLEVRARMQLGAACAGLAIENSMLGAAHSAANPLTAHLNVVHGQAVGVMLPHVIRFNGADPAAAEIYLELARIAGLVPPGGEAPDAVLALADRVEDLVAASPLPSAMPAPEVMHRLLPTLVAEAADQWTARFNPREVSEPDFDALYQQAFVEPSRPGARQERREPGLAQALP